MNSPLPSPKLVLIALLCALAADFCPAQTGEQAGEENTTLIALGQEFDGAYERINQPVVQLNASFAGALERLFESESAAGNLDNALAVKAEMEAFGDGSVFDPKAFDDRATDFDALENFRNTYRTERERLRGLGKGQREELLKHFQARLLDVERQFTQSGDLEAAVAARNARESLESDPRFAETDPIEGSAAAPSDPEFDGTFWEFRNRSGRLGELEFLAGGTIRSKEYPESSWLRVNEDTIRFQYGKDEAAGVAGGHVTFRFQGTDRTRMSGRQSELGTTRYLHKIDK